MGFLRRLWYLVSALVSVLVLAACSDRGTERPFEVASTRAELEAAPTLLIDTGQAADTGGSSLFAKGSTLCSPQPGCAQSYQYLGGRFELLQPARLDSVEAWIGRFGTGGPVDVHIRLDASGVPGASIYVKHQAFPSTGTLARWAPVPDFDVVLGAGRFWVTFEPVEGSNTSLSMPHGAPEPLSDYAFNADGNFRWINYGLFGSQPGLGLRVYGVSAPSVVAFGTATRIVQYQPHVLEEPRAERQRGGVDQASSSTWYFTSHYGIQATHAKIVGRDPAVGVFSHSNGDFGAARAVAFRTYVNGTSAPLALRANAIFEGRFEPASSPLPTGHLAAGAAIHIVDTAEFSAAVKGSPDVLDYLVGNEMDNIELEPDTQLSLLRARVGDALRATATVFLEDGPYDQGLERRLATSSTTIEPGQTFTLLFDAASVSYARPFGGRIGGGTADFLQTLKPDDVLFTDEAGNPVVGIELVGDEVEATPAAAHVVLAPTGTSAPLGNNHSLLATVTTAAGALLPQQLVQYEVISGPNTGLLGIAETDATGVARFEYLGATSGTGTDAIVARIGDLHSNTATHEWLAGPLAHIEIAPADAIITTAQKQQYAALGFDAYGNPLGDVTAQTAFSIAPGGACVEALCGAPVGVHTVTAVHAVGTASARLEVLPAYEFEGFFAPVTVSSASPVWNAVKAGQAVPFKWRLTEAGVPVADPTSFAGLQSYAVRCDTGAAAGLPPVTANAPGGSGLTGHGDGNWQYNWKTPKSDAGSCRAVYVRFDDGSTSPLAFFQLR